MVILALYFLVVFVVEGCRLWVSQLRQVQRSSRATNDLPRLPNCVIGIDILISGEADASLMLNSVIWDTSDAVQTKDTVDETKTR